MEHYSFSGDLTMKKGDRKNSPSVFWTHPSLPDKYIREQIYTRSYEAASQALLNKQLFDALQLRGIAHVPVQHMVGEGYVEPTGKVNYVYAITDVIPSDGDVVSLLEDRREGARIARDADDLNTRLMMHFCEVIEHGGIYSSEIERLDQFARHTETGELVLVDTEPHYVDEVEDGKDVTNSDRESFLLGVESFAHNTILIERAAQQESRSRNQLFTLLDAINVDHPEYESAKMFIKWAVEHGELDVLDEYFNIDDEDNEWEKIMISLRRG